MKKLSQKTLSELIDRCNQKDEDAWHTLINYIAPYIFAICSKSKLTRDESFDIFGQVSLQLINSISKLRDAGKIFSFAGTITRREIYAFYQRIELANHLDDEIVNSIPDKYGKSPEDDYLLLEKRELLMEAMLSLPERDYKLIWMLYFDPKQLSYKEIADKLHMPVSSVGPIRGKVLVKLYKYLKNKQTGK